MNGLMTAYYKFLDGIKSEDALKSEKLIRSVGYIFEASLVSPSGQIKRQRYYFCISQKCKDQTRDIIKARIYKDNTLSVLVKNATGNYEGKF